MVARQCDHVLAIGKREQNEQLLCARWQHREGKKNFRSRIERTLACRLSRRMTKAVNDKKRRLLKTILDGTSPLWLCMCTQFNVQLRAAGGID